MNLFHFHFSTSFYQHHLKFELLIHVHQPISLQQSHHFSMNLILISFIFIHHNGFNFHFVILNLHLILSYFTIHCFYLH